MASALINDVLYGVHILKKARAWLAGLRKYAILSQSGQSSDLPLLAKFLDS